MEQTQPANYRTWFYLGFSALLTGFYALVSQINWIGSVGIHTLMEVIATTLAIVISLIALVHYLSKHNNQFLFIGCAFLGTALLDSYHTIVTSRLFATYFESYLASSPTSLIPWSWNASRIFLGLMLLLSNLMRRREERLGEAGLVHPVFVYGATALLTATAFLFFTLTPLPTGYYEGPLFGRPEEFIAAVIFALALICYLTNNHRQRAPFEFWLISSLVVSLFTQAVFMSRSFGLYDNMFDAAHLLKLISYALVFIGLLVDISDTYVRAELNAKLSDMYETLNQEVIRRRNADK
ncbi:MAG: MASE3 domain-containing protein, partial [Planctomycetota bacterium]